MNHVINNYKRQLKSVYKTETYSDRPPIYLYQWNLLMVSLWADQHLYQLTQLPMIIFGDQQEKS